MRLFLIGALCLVVAGSASANTTVVVEEAPFCGSSAHPVVLVTQSGRNVAGARLDVYRRIEHGEKLAWSRSTDQQGVARLGELEPGSCRVLAYSGKLFANMRLGISDNSDGASTCEFKLVPPIGAEQQQKEALAALVRNAPSIQLKEFRGVVEDENEAVIPRLKIQVLRRGALDKFPYSSAHARFELDAVPQGLKPEDLGKHDAARLEGAPFQNKISNRSESSKTAVESSPLQSTKIKAARRA